MFLSAISMVVLMLAHVAVCDNNDHGKIAVSHSADTFAEALSANRNFVMFYAPWCGHCKNLAPTWDELAKLYNTREDSPVIISKVDCTIHTQLCADQEIIGFPTLKLFPVGGADPHRYTGKRDLESFKTFLSIQLDEPQAEEKVLSEPVQDGGVVVLTDQTFDDHASTGFHFVKFYAPWCGHCKRLAPIWDDLAVSVKDMDASIDKVDCDANPVTCSKFEIRGYPTLVLFHDGDKVISYQGERSVDALQGFLKKEMIKIQGEEDEGDDVVGDDVGDDHDEQGMGEDDEHEEEPGTVKELTVDNFKAFLATRLVFTKFYAPWCGHCKRLAPVWEDLAKELEAEEVSIAKVDCTLHKAVCDEHQVRGYPTLKIFRNGEKLEDYRQSRSLESLAGYARTFIKGHDEL